MFLWCNWWGIASDVQVNQRGLTWMSPRNMSNNIYRTLGVFTDENSEMTWWSTKSELDGISCSWPEFLWQECIKMCLKEHQRHGRQEVSQIELEQNCRSKLSLEIGKQRRQSCPSNCVANLRQEVLNYVISVFCKNLSEAQPNLHCKVHLKMPMTLDPRTFGGHQRDWGV